MEFGASPASSVRELLLIRNGVYCGQRFKRDGFQAVWFVEEDQIKFHAPDGSLIATSKPSEIGPIEHRVAA